MANRPIISTTRGTLNVIHHTPLWLVLGAGREDWYPFFFLARTVPVSAPLCLGCPLRTGILVFTFLCSGPQGSVYGPTSLPVDWIEDDCFRCDRIQCLRSSKVLVTLAFCRNAWRRLFASDSAWHVADATAAKRASDFQARTFACSMYQPDTVFLVGCAALAGLLVNRGALLRGFSAGSYSCSAAAIVWRHILPEDSRLHLRIGAISMPPPVLVGISDKGGDYPLGSVLAVQVVSDTACPWNQVEQSGVRNALKAMGIGLIALVDDCYSFGPRGHNYNQAGF